MLRTLKRFQAFRAISDIALLSTLPHTGVNELCYTSALNYCTFKNFSQYWKEKGFSNDIVLQHLSCNFFDSPDYENGL